MAFVSQLYRTQRENPLARAILSLLQAREQRLKQYDLRNLEIRFADAECRDPRNRIYALLALVDPWICRQITAVYSKPLMQVFFETTGMFPATAMTMTRAYRLVLTSR
jgi:hypothetical protein